MAGVVRASKYRHVWGELLKDKYECLRLSSKPTESTQIKGNGKFLAVSWDSAGGSVAVLPLESYGKVSHDIKLVRAHAGAVLDFDFNPFHDNLLATCSEDSTIKVWGIPDGGLTEDLTTELSSLSGHAKKVSFVQFHPTADHVLASASFDQTVRVWDVEANAEVYQVGGHQDNILSLQWNYDGSLLTTTCKDRMLRVIDPRGSVVSHETRCHEGTKSAKACWLGPSNRLFTVGFSKQSERQYALWDMRNFSEPLYQANLDQGSGVILPFFDDATNMLFLAGKGDGNIRYYELVDEHPYIHYLSQYQSTTAARGLCVLPKRTVNVMQCEVVRTLKVCTNTVEHISFRVPRKAETFQEDLFPDCPSFTPALTAEAWFGGANSGPVLMSLRPNSESSSPSHSTASFNPAPRRAPASSPTAASSSASSGSSDVLAEKEKQITSLQEELAALRLQLASKDSQIEQLQKDLETARAPSA
eukprot:GILI01002569.1.p1 GENE.GILI01002569.1~~GILI01002569.1.p1  ORF type:complete len:485 (+),score=153.73 GILI01002569.1:38-1456(+)